MCRLLHEPALGDPPRMAMGTAETRKPVSEHDKATARYSQEPLLERDTHQPSQRGSTDGMYMMWPMKRMHKLRNTIHVCI